LIPSVRGVDGAGIGDPGETPPLEQVAGAKRTVLDKAANQRWTPTGRRDEPMRKLLATVTLTFAVMAVLPASAAAATAVEYGLIAAL
jgi:hypothetical protein